MTKLGTYPSRRYKRAWITQRLVNRAPEYTFLRQNPASIGQQFLNPIGLNIQDTVQQLTEERYNMFISSMDISMLDLLYLAELPSGMTFNSTVNNNGSVTYSEPTVYGVLNDTEYELSIAENNNIRTLWNEAVPSRIADGETSYTYNTVLARTLISSLDSATPLALPIPGHLYVTVRNNETWELRDRNGIYYSKIWITGRTRKGEDDSVEAIPIRYNGTFKTINQWESVESISVAHFSEDATITIEVFPFDTAGLLDVRNVNVPVSGGERIRFMRLGDQTYGSTFVAESFTSANLEVVRLGVDVKEIEYELELLTASEANVDLNGFVAKPGTDYIYAIDDDTFYVYDIALPYPDVREMTNGSPSPKVDLFSDKWTYVRGSTATIKTRIVDISDPPYRVRWTLKDPDGNEYYMGLDGSLWATTTNAWIDNHVWEQNRFEEQQINISLDTAGIYLITLETAHINRETDLLDTYTTKFFFYVPAITPEASYDLPVDLQNAEDISIDSDGQVWLLKENNIHLLDIFHDYFLVDYDNHRIWLREQYSSVRVVP